MLLASSLRIMHARPRSLLALSYRTEIAEEAQDSLLGSPASCSR